MWSIMSSKTTNTVICIWIIFFINVESNMLCLKTIIWTTCRRIRVFFMSISTIAICILWTMISIRNFIILKFLNTIINSFIRYIYRICINNNLFVRFICINTWFSINLFICVSRRWNWIWCCLGNTTLF